MHDLAAASSLACIDADTEIDAALVLERDASGYQMVDASGQIFNKPFQLNFNQRRYRASGRDPLVKAMGKLTASDEQTQILDATAGWAQDAIHLAEAGFSVTALEREPLVYALVTEALARLDDAALASRITLIQADSCAYINASPSQNKLDIVYLDPMFPDKNKPAASTKKPMTLMQYLTNPLTAKEEYELLTAARNYARKRVVVKRPLRAEALCGATPSGCIRGKLVRFDIYSPS